MNQRINSLYFLIVNNYVEIYDTNLTSFVARINEKYPETKNYLHHYRKFKESSKFEYLLKTGQRAYLQKL